MLSKVVLTVFTYLLSSASAMPIAEGSDASLSQKTTFSANWFKIAPKLESKGYFNRFSSNPDSWETLSFKDDEGSLGQISYDLEFRGPERSGKFVEYFKVMGQSMWYVDAAPGSDPKASYQHLSLSDYKHTYLNEFTSLKFYHKKSKKHFIFQNKKGDAVITFGGDVVKNPYVKWDINKQATAENAALINPKTGEKQTVNISFSPKNQYTIIPEKYIKQAEEAGLQSQNSTAPYMCLSSENGTPLCLGYLDICRKDPKIATPNLPRDTTCKPYFKAGNNDEVILGNDLWRLFDISIDFDNNVAAFGPVDYKYADYKIGSQ